MRDTVLFVGIGMWLIGLCVAWVIIKTAVHAALRDHRRELAREAAKASIVTSHAAELQPEPAGPGRFRVDGVVRETGTETSLYIDAKGEAYARAKAELKGVIVTDVQRA